MQVGEQHSLPLESTVRTLYHRRLRRVWAKEGVGGEEEGGEEEEEEVHQRKLVV